MKCPKCKKMMQLVELYTSIMGESRLLFYCNNCDKALNTPVNFIQSELGELK